MVATFRAGGRVLAFGNGGSAADAQHLAAELAGRFERERPGLPALALTANSSDLTAIGNDYGFERVFARLVRAHGRPATWPSPSRPRAIRRTCSRASPRRARSVSDARPARPGRRQARGRRRPAIVVPSDVTARIQESHIAVIHLLCEIVDDALFPEPGRTLSGPHHASARATSPSRRWTPS